MAAGQLGPSANDEDAIYVVSTLIVGVLSQAIANEPDLPWGEGRFTPTFARLMRLLPLRSHWPERDVSLTTRRGEPSRFRHGRCLPVVP